MLMKKGLCLSLRSVDVIGQIGLVANQGKGKGGIGALGLGLELVAKRLDSFKGLGMI